MSNTTEKDIALYRETNMMGQSAMKACILLNGGAAIAMLALIGSVINSTSNRPEELKNILLLALCGSAKYFVWGALLTMSHP